MHLILSIIVQSHRSVAMWSLCFMQCVAFLIIYSLNDVMPLTPVQTNFPIVCHETSKYLTCLIELAVLSTRPYHIRCFQLITWHNMSISSIVHKVEMISLSSLWIHLAVEPTHWWLKWWLIIRSWTLSQVTCVSKHNM